MAYQEKQETFIRRVEPYAYEYKSYARQKWVGMTMRQLFTTQFRDKSPEQYLDAIDNGRMLIKR